MATEDILSMILNGESEITCLHTKERRIGYICVILADKSTLSLNNADKGRKKHRVEFKDHMVKDNKGCSRSSEMILKLIALAFKTLLFSNVNVMFGISIKIYIVWCII